MRQVRVPMTARDVDEEHRASTPLELFFDLVFVIAVAQASAGLHHGLLEGGGHVGQTIIGFLLVFFAIWWAWMNFSWFASAYDTDDAPYRLAVFVIMIGVLILAAGISRVFQHQNAGILTLGYVVMRVAMVALWLRAAFAHREGRACALRYAIGIAVLQVLWIGRLLLPESVALASFLVLAIGELAVPYWAETAGRTTWHPGHIAERYGLFTIIVLGESLLSATVGVQSVLDSDTSLVELTPIIIGGLFVVFSMWWIYFDLPTESLVAAARSASFEQGLGPFLWGYGHYFIFASVAATGAGIAVAIDHATDHGEISDIGAGLAVAIPVALFLLTVWLLHAPQKAPGAFRTWAVPLTVVLVLASAFTAAPVLCIGVVMALLVTISTIVKHQRNLADEAALSSQ